MTLVEAKNTIISYLVKNTDVSALSVESISDLGMGDPKNNKDVAAFILAMESLEELGIFKKKQVAETYYWVLSFKITEQPQSVEMSYPLVDAIAKTIEQYVNTNTEKGKETYTVNRAALTEQDVAMLLYIISDLTNNLQKENT